MSDFEAASNCLHLQFQTRLSQLLRRAPPSAGHCRLCSDLKSDLETDYVKESVFGVSGVAPIMAKDHPALQELFKTRSGELQFPLLCLLLAHLTSFVAVAPWTKDPLVSSRTDKFFNEALQTLSGVEDKDLSAYLNHKATA